MAKEVVGAHTGVLQDTVEQSALQIDGVERNAYLHSGFPRVTQIAVAASLMVH